VAKGCDQTDDLQNAAVRRFPPRRRRTALRLMLYRKWAEERERTEDRREEIAEREAGTAVLKRSAKSGALIDLGIRPSCVTDPVGTVWSEIFRKVSRMYSPRDLPRKTLQESQPYAST